MNQRDRVHTFRDLHRSGFILPNAWDAASARILEQAGFPAIGTTSAGIAHARGRQDGQTLSREEMLREVRGIIQAVNIPVNADIEAGYGDDPTDVKETVSAFVSAGAVGINLEDATGIEAKPLYTVSEQVERLHAGRTAIDRNGLPIFLNARIDTYLLGTGSSSEERLALTLARGRAYRAAEADGLFIPMATDPALIATLSRELGAPLNVLAFPGAPAPAVMLAAGATRVSYGQSLMLAALGLTAQVAGELRETGSSRAMDRHFYGFGKAHSLFRES